MILMLMIPIRAGFEYVQGARPHRASGFTRAAKFPSIEVVDQEVDEELVVKEEIVDDDSEVEGLVRVDKSDFHNDDIEIPQTEPEMDMHQPQRPTVGNNTEASVPITESLVPEVTQSQNTNHTSTSSHHAPQDRWLKDKHVELVNIIGDPGEGMLTRSMTAKLTAATASGCLFTLVPLPHIKIAISSKWVFRNKKDEHGIVTKNKARLVAQGYSQEEGIDYDETFAPVARMEAIKIFLAFATYMNFTVFQMDVKSVFLIGKLKEGVYVKQPPGFESSEFPDYVCKLDKALYRLKQACSLVKTPMVPLNNLGPDLAGKPVNDTLYRGMIGSLMYQKGTPSLGLYYPKCSGFDLKGYSDSYYAG
ncbi:retrovirus-related pol polyprotein from transposon TNT 1-94 [Tanacetum coccineum]